MELLNRWWVNQNQSVNQRQKEIKQKLNHGMREISRGVKPNRVKRIWSGLELVTKKDIRIYWMRLRKELMKREERRKYSQSIDLVHLLLMHKETNSSSDNRRKTVNEEINRLEEK